MRLLVLFLAFALVLGMVPPMPLNAEPVEGYDYEYLYQAPTDEGEGYEYPTYEAIPEDEDDEYPVYESVSEYYAAALETDFSHLQFGVRSIATPVAGHFPTSLYRWSVRPLMTDPTINAHSYGYYLTFVWYPAVERYFLPNTAYSVEIIMEPATAVTPPNWDSARPPANMWANVIGANVPPSFSEIGATYAQVVGLPTEGVASVTSRYEGDNMHVTVNFEPTGSAVEDARLVFFEDFSNNSTTAFLRPGTLFRQDMSIWMNSESFFRNDQMVLSYRLATPAQVQQHRPAWVWFENEAARERATYNTIISGAMRTINQNFTQKTFEHAFGYYEARIRFPSAYQHNKQGTWGAFWLMNRNLTFDASSLQHGATGRGGAEIDIFESIDNHINGQFNSALHWGGYLNDWGGNNVRSFSQRVDSTDDFWVNIYDGNYHLFSVEWSPTDYRFFVNGIEIGSLSRAQEGLGLSPWFPRQLEHAQQHEINQNPNYIKLSVESALWALNSVGADFNFPRDLYGEMVVDYVAVWNGPRPNVSINELANYAALDAALAAASALLPHHYTADSWAALVAAVDAANELPRNLSAALQYQVDAVAVAITNAIDNLIPVTIFTFNIFNNGEGGSPSRPNPGLAAAGTIRMWTQLDGNNDRIYWAARDTIVALDQNGNCAMEFITVSQIWQPGGFLPYFNMIDVNANGAWRTINFAITAHGQTVHVLLVNPMSPGDIVRPVPGFDIFNNGEGGSPSRPNPGLAASGTIRMWAQLDGVNTPMYIAAEGTIEALDQNGDCAMDFITVNEMWQAGTGFLPYFNRIDVNKNEPWRYINFSITVHGQLVELLLVNSNYVPANGYHTVTFTVQPGAVGVYLAPGATTSVQVPHGEMIPAGNIPSAVARPGFYFAGWYPSNPAEHGNVYGNLEFTAIFNPLFHYVTFEAGAGGAPMLPSPTNPLRIRDGFGIPAASVPSPEALPGYVFVEWVIDGTGAVDPAGFVVRENMTFTAIFEADSQTPAHIYDVRPVARPVAGHFPTGFYRLFLRPNGSAGYVLEHNYGYYQSIAWYPAVSRDFQPHTVYTAIVTLEPHLTSLPEGTNGWWSVIFCDDPDCTNPHDPLDRIPPHNDHPDAWVLREGLGRPVWPPNFSSCTTTKPATFAGVTIDALAGLPTEGVTGIAVENCTDNPANLVIRITFEATAETQPAQVTLFDDFSGPYNPYDRHGGLTTQFARATDNMWRQSMSYWSFENANIQERDGNSVLVLANELIRETVDDYQAYIANLLLDYSWVVPTPRERENALRSGAVRTISHDWYEIYFEQSFGYWEARIKLPQERGMWGAFWLMNRYQGTNVNFHQGVAARNGRTGAELDIVEGIISSAANYNNSRFNSAVHYNGWGGMVDGSWQGSRSFSVGSDRNTAPFVNIFDGNWHTFSMEWTPTSYRFFVNGIQFGPTVYDGTHGPVANRHNISHNPTYMKLSTEAGGATPGAAAWPLGAGMHFRDGFFAEMLVDYVRVWNGPRPESAPVTPATLVSVEISGNAVPNQHLEAVLISNPAGQTLIPAATFQWQHLCHTTDEWVNVPNRILGTGQAAGSALGGLEYRLTNHIPSAVTTNRRLHLVEGDLAILGYYIRVAVTHDGVTVYSDPVPFRTRTLDHEFDIRPIVSPVAGHFPTSLYRWSIRSNRTDPAIDEHSFGYYLTLVWYPEIPHTFQPDTVYSVEIIMEPATNVWVPDWHDLHPGANMWARVIGENVPASFAQLGLTHEDIVGLPTEGVTDVTSRHVGDNLHITVTFAPTGEEMEEAQLIFFDDFSGSRNEVGLTTVWDRAPHDLFRQDMSIWRDEMSDIRDNQMVLSYQLATPTGGRTTIQEEFEYHMPAWWAQWPPFNPTQMAHAANNFVEAGAVRTLTADWLEATFEHAFGYYEARIRFPAEYAQNKRGTWGAFWLMNRNLTFEAALPAATGRSGAEIDVFESIGNHTGRFNAAVHWGGYVQGGSSRSFTQSADRSLVDIYDGNYHTFSVEWSPTDYRFFVNGIEFGSLSRAREATGNTGLRAREHEVNQNPNYIKLSVETARWALTSALGQTGNFPRDLFGEMIIDYVAVWNGPRPATNLLPDTHEFVVRPISSPVAGHFPASLYRWALTPGNARAIGGTPLPGHNYGYDHTLVWSPAIERYFLPDTVYTLEWILEPNPEWHGVYWTPLELGIPVDPYDMRWWQNIPASMPPSFAANNITHEDITGLPTERVTSITSEHRGANLHIFITFEATGSEIQAPSVIFHDDFSNPVDTDPDRPGAITAHSAYSTGSPASGFARATPYLWRQDLSYWDPEMAWIDEDRNLLVLGVERYPDGFDLHAPAWMNPRPTWLSQAQFDRTRRNTLRAGGVRTMSQDWESVYWENAFGFYEARISFPDPTVVHGAWGAFWLMNRYLGYTATDSVRGQEIDIIETIDGHINGRFNWAVHWSHAPWEFTGRSRRYHSEDIADVSIYDGGFHTFAVEWSPTEYIFFVNGIEVGRLSDVPATAGLAVNRNPNYMKLSMESARWALPGGNNGSADMPLPLGQVEHMYVDYVTVWNGPRPLPDTDREQLYFLANNYGALTADDVDDFAAYTRALENLMVIVDSPLVEQWLIDRIIAEFLATLRTPVSDAIIRGVPAVSQVLEAEIPNVTHDHTFRWQVSPDGGTTWNNVTGAAGASQRLALTAPHYGQFARIIVSYGGVDLPSAPVGPIARAGVRYIATPVAGHFPTSLYKWPFRHNAGDTGAGNVGFNSTITWYPPITGYFQPNTIYTATLLLEPNPQWAAANRPGAAALGGGANFAAANITHLELAGVPIAGAPMVYNQHVLGLPTGGATSVSSVHDGGSLVITIVFEATGQLEEAMLILNEEFTAGPSINPAIGQPQRVTDTFVRSITGVRQGMSTWQNDMSFIRDDVLVLGFERMNPADVTDSMIWDWTWCTINNGPIARYNYIRSGAVRTMGQAWSGLNSEMTFENAFGYYEARIKFPDARGGTWGAFWLMNRLQGQTSAAQQSATGFNHTFFGRGGAEIDIIETIGAHNNLGFNAATHFDSWQSGHQGSWPGNTDTLGGMNIYDGGWHTFSVEWSPNDYRFFINGFEFARLSDLSTNLYLPIGEGGWPGLTHAGQLEVNQNPNYVKLSMEAAVWNLIAQGALVAEAGEMLVDWVRVWNGPRPASAYTPANHADMPEQRVTLADVTISGNAVVGQTLTATVVTQPEGQPLPVSAATLQWQQSATGAVGSWSNIANANTATLLLTDAQLGLYIRVVSSHGGLTRQSNVLGPVVEAPPVFSLNVFNNGVINNQSLANAGLIRLWTRLDGVNANVLITGITAVDQDDNDAMEHLRRINTVGVSPQNGFDVNFDAPWQRIYLTVTAYGQTIELVLTNPRPPVVAEFSLNVFNNGVINNQSLANAGLIRLWTRLDGVNANVLITEITAVDQDNNDATEHLRRINTVGVSPQNGFDVNFNAPWQRIYLTVTAYGQTIELTLVNPM